ncbi:phosphoribosyltransferase [Geodermatophilus obscurus]|uniref:Phosphoribosyltransferase n=1 Tax=Geodermatophilus obscurus (strain ATCC 25078 / DSM 43160 / JCM 3152 / CCUG 61914 / KCC A-0152 / KCTC 9177 / NBRC 13315 / NRRL B-3577 / G-20) TaxID=526225 RepID=D2SA07_GEOOG|nr:phosphoribosyltransferase [Geodermatophilus obscurus]ADB75822.1 phosphoribosyltransferase [Geodermatophilus obscurus DSM 43160]
MLAGFRWVDGHADVWALLAEGRGPAAVVRGLTASWADAGTTHVVGLEARGFAVGGPAAVVLGAGFVPVRKGLLPGRSLATTSAEDHRGVRHELHVQAVPGPGDPVLLVDDWAERGSQAEATAELVRRQGAELLGLALVVDELPDAVRAALLQEPAASVRRWGAGGSFFSGGCAGWPGGRRP